MKLSKSSFPRIKALSLYYIYTLRGNPVKFFLMIFWPIFDLIIWGFATIYLRSDKLEAPTFLTFILGATIAWNLLWRAQQEVSQQFMQDIFSRNFQNIFITPVKLWETIIALISSSLAKLILILSLLSLFVYFLFSFNLLKLSPWLIIFFANLIVFGWTLGVISIAIVLRFGYRFEFLTWALALLISPFSCVFYSRNSLPPFLKSLSYLAPPSYIFESMRAIILKGNSWISNLYLASFLNLIYILSASIFFIFMLKWAKKSGSLARI